MNAAEEMSQVRTHFQSKVKVSAHLSGLHGSERKAEASTFDYVTKLLNRRPAPTPETLTALDRRMIALLLRQVDQAKRRGFSVGISPFLQSVLQLSESR